MKLALAFALCASGCAHEDQLRAALDEAGRTASFELECPQGSLTTAVFARSGNPATVELFDIAARGCGRMQSYRVGCGPRGCAHLEAPQLRTRR